jgi:hypothetical protein
MNCKKSGHLDILFLLLLLIPVGSMAQPGGRIVIQEKDSATVRSTTSLHSFYGGAGYGSNMIYLGSSISENLPFEYASFAYGFKNSFYASVSGVHLNGLTPFGAFYIGSLSWNHTFNSWFDISADAYRYQVANSLADSLFSSFVYGSLTLGFDWRVLYTKISGGGLFSKENTAYFQIRNSRYFQTPDFLRGKADISFDPYINLLFGTLLKIETGTETVYTYPRPGRKWKFVNPSQATYSYLTKNFGLLEMDFGLPVAFNTDLMTVELEGDYVLPLHSTPDYPGPKGFVFTLSAFFRIF